MAKSIGSHVIRVGLRVIGAAGLTVLLIGFLVASRVWFANAKIPDREIRTLETIEAVAMPSPPPPPEEITEVEPPPPPPPPTLPQLDLQIEQLAPPLAAVVSRDLDFTMANADFELEVDPVALSSDLPKPASSTPTKQVGSKPTPARTVYSSGELDAKPRLLNRPAAAYPAAQLRRGVRQGKVLLEVSISASGRCSVRRVIASTHPDFSAMARSFASRARFSTPKKNGRAVTAIYKWPLILRP
ncbi:MAG: TonB family protein [Verrucomicrobiales bacterium]|nr:TonB family protein [Verrucomicrobiales bacterium]